MIILIFQAMTKIDTTIIETKALNHHIHCIRVRDSKRNYLSLFISRLDFSPVSYYIEKNFSNRSIYLLERIFKEQNKIYLL